MARGWNTGRDDDQEIAPGGQLRQGGLVRPGHTSHRATRVVAHFHVEAQAAARDGPPNAAQPRHAHAGAADLAAQPKTVATQAGPLPGAHKAVGLGRAAGHVQQQRKGRIGHAVVEHIRGVTHGNAPGLGFFDRHLVQAHPKAGDHLDRGQCRQVLGRQANRCTGHHRIKLCPMLCQEGGWIGFICQAVHAVAGVQGLFQRGYQFACLEDAVQGVHGVGSVRG